MMRLVELSIDQVEEIARFFAGVFTKEPWKDDWSDENQLHAYIMDLIGNRNSLTVGLFDDGQMMGLSMGSVKHWYSGTEYYIHEFCIKTEQQGKGVGTQFLHLLESFIQSKGIKQIFLQTDRNVPAYHFYKKNGYKELENHVSFVKCF